MIHGWFMDVYKSSRIGVSKITEGSRIIHYSSNWTLFNDLHYIFQMIYIYIVGLYIHHPVIVYTCLNILKPKSWKHHLKGKQNSFVLGFSMIFLWKINISIIFPWFSLAREGDIYRRCWCPSCWLIALLPAPRGTTHPGHSLVSSNMASWKIPELNGGLNRKISNIYIYIERDR